MADTLHRYTDFVIDWTRGREIQLDLVVNKNGAAQNITTGDVWVTGKDRFEVPDAAAPIRLNTALLGGVTKTTPLSGLATAVIPGSASANLPVKKDGTVVYIECVYEDANGVPHTFQTGTITFYPNANRDA